MNLKAVVSNGLSLWFNPGNSLQWSELHLRTLPAGSKLLVTFGLKVLFLSGRQLSAPPVSIASDFPLNGEPESVLASLWMFSIPWKGMCFEDRFLEQEVSSNPSISHYSWALFFITKYQRFDFKFLIKLFEQQWFSDPDGLVRGFQHQSCPGRFSLSCEVHLKQQVLP